MRGGGTTEVNPPALTVISVWKHSPFPFPQPGEVLREPSTAYCHLNEGGHCRCPSSDLSIWGGAGEASPWQRWFWFQYPFLPRGGTADATPSSSGGELTFRLEIIGVKCYAAILNDMAAWNFSYNCSFFFSYFFCKRNFFSSNCSFVLAHLGVIVHFSSYWVSYLWGFFSNIFPSRSFSLWFSNQGHVFSIGCGDA